MQAFHVSWYELVPAKQPDKYSSCGPTLNKAGHTCPTPYRSPKLPDVCICFYLN